MTTKDVKVYPTSTNRSSYGRTYVFVGALVVLMGVTVAWNASSADQEPGRLVSPTSSRIIETNPMPSRASASGEAFWSEMNRRVERWVGEVEAGHLAQDELGQNVLALTEELRLIGQSRSAHAEWMEVREIMERRQALCVILGPSYESASGVAPCKTP
jgi:hypothetical protein